MFAPATIANCVCAVLSQMTLVMGKEKATKVVSEQLGHSSTAFTWDIYVHVLPSLQKEATRRLKGILKRR